MLPPPISTSNLKFFLCPSVPTFSYSNIGLILPKTFGFKFSNIRRQIPCLREISGIETVEHVP